MPEPQSDPQPTAPTLTPDSAGMPTAVAAHVLLNSASVIVLGASSLDERWDTLSAAERREVAARIRLHAEQLVADLKQLVRPEAPLVG